MQLAGEGLYEREQLRERAGSARLGARLGGGFAAGVAVLALVGGRMKRRDWAILCRVTIDGGPRKWGQKGDENGGFLRPGQLGTYLPGVVGGLGLASGWPPNYRSDRAKRKQN